MKATTIILCLGFLAVAGYVYAQRFPTNNISQEHAIKIASRLWAGMSQAEVEKAVDKQNGLKTGGNVGSPVSGWTRFYVLSNDCSLDLRFDPKGLGSNFWLSAASITKRTGEKVVSITLTNAP
jgi:hypothetical protein